MLTAKIGKFRRVLMSSTAAMAACALSVDAMAQQQQQANDDEALELEEIIVTGSRIKRAGMFNNTKPTVVVDESVFDNRNFTNVMDALMELPQFSLGADNLGPQGQNTGQSFADLFGLGTQRTLTLINGRRAVGGNTPSGGGDGAQVDLNVIPAGLVERIETVSVGGAPLYGTDAVAGTVNIILKDDYEGFELTGQFGITDEGDGAETQFTALWGGNFADGRGNATLSVEFLDQNPIRVTERPDTFIGKDFVNNPANTSATDGIPNQILIENSRIFVVTLGGFPLLGGGDTSLASIFSNPFTDPVLGPDGSPTQFGPNGDLVPFNPGQQFGGEFVFAGGGDGIPIAIFDELRAESQRINVAGNAHFDLTDNLRIFTETLFSTQDNVDPTNQPFINANLFPGDERQAIGIRLDNAFLSDQARQVIENNLPAAGVDADGDGVDDRLLVDTNGDGIPDQPGFFLQRFSQDILQGTQFQNETDMYRIVMGFEGQFEFMDRTFDWDFAYNFGRTESVTESPTRLIDNFFRAIDAVEDPDTGEIVCRSTLNPPDPATNPGAGVDVPVPQGSLSNCVPLNLFGEGNFSQAAQDFVVVTDLNESELEQETVEFNLTGSLFDLPGGSVQFASGILYRDEFGDFNPGGVTEFGLDGAAPIAPISGSFRTWEGYFESRIPVISRDMDFLDFGFFDWMLEFEGAVRAIGNNSPGTGTDVAYSAGGRISPFEGLVFRGNFTRSVRAPAIGELFLANQEFTGFATDPCDTDNLASGPSPANRQANCRRAVIEAGLASSNAEADAFLANFQSIVGNASQNIFTTGGNPELGNEIATNFTAGAQWTPSFIPGLRIGIDWTDIELTDAIFNVDQDSVLSACFDVAPGSFPSTPCSAVARGNGFQLSRVDTGFQNIGFIKFAGLTGRLNYTSAVSDLPFMPDGDLGQIGISFNLQYIDQLENSVLGTGDDLDIDRGEATDPKYQWVARLNYDLRQFHFLLQANYTDGTEIDAQQTDEARDILTMPSFLEFQTTLGYDVTENISARFTIDNFTNALPVPQAVATGNAFSGSFDVIGRRYSLRLTARY